jgi:hypothetical protein
MPEEITVDKKRGIILVRSWGDISYEDLVSSREKTFVLYVETGIDKILVDARQQKSMITIGETYDFSESIGRDSRSRKMKWAIVPSKHTKAGARFLETTSRNRGLNVMIHDTIESALKWLKE